MPSAAVQDLPSAPAVGVRTTQGHTPPHVVMTAGACGAALGQFGLPVRHKLAGLGGACQAVASTFCVPADRGQRPPWDVNTAGRPGRRQSDTCRSRPSTASPGEEGLYPCVETTEHQAGCEHRPSRCPAAARRRQVAAVSWRVKRPGCSHRRRTSSVPPIAEESPGRPSEHRTSSLLFDQRLPGFSHVMAAAEVLRSKYSALCHPLQAPPDDRCRRRRPPPPARRTARLPLPHGAGGRGRV